MTSVLITGGAGFIGSNFVDYWMSTYPTSRVTVLDSLTYAADIKNVEHHFDNLNFSLIEASITDESAVMDAFSSNDVKLVVHFAAESHVDRSISGPRAFIDTNVVGTHVLLEVARKLWISDGVCPEAYLFHHVSTDEVYGSLTPEAAAFTETHPYQPNSPYAASKAASDHLVSAYQHTYGLNTKITNCSNNYGPFQNEEKLIPLMIENALHGRTMPIYGDGQNVRDWLHVSDHCVAIDRVIESGRVGETYNIGGNTERTNVQIVESICSAIEYQFTQDATLCVAYPECPAAKSQPVSGLVRFVTDRLGHDRRYAVDATKIKAELGFSPAVVFEQGLTETVQWYINKNRNDRSTDD